MLKQPELCFTKDLHYLEHWKPWAKDASKYPTIHMEVPTTKPHPAQNVNSAEGENQLQSIQADQTAW